MGTDDLCDYLLKKKSSHHVNKHSNKAENLHSIIKKKHNCETIKIKNHQDKQFNSKYPISRSNTFRKLSNF